MELKCKPNVIIEYKSPLSNAMQLKIQKKTFQIKLVIFIDAQCNEVDIKTSLT